MNMLKFALRYNEAIYQMLSVFWKAALLLRLLWHGTHWGWYEDNITWEGVKTDIWIFQQFQSPKDYDVL